MWRAAITWTVLIAFALQAWVTQTHFHHPPISQAAASGLSAQAPGPADQGEAVCPLCQAVAVAGAFLGAGPLALLLPTLRAEAAETAAIVISLALATAGFSWRSRAPPQT